MGGESATKRRENFLEALVRVASFRLQHARLSRAEASREALRLNRESSAHAVGISQQCFGIIPKIREVDDYMDS